MLDKDRNISTGWIEVICGPMFSGKTEELLRRLRRARIANQSIAIFKPAIDTRYHEMRIVSHDANFYPSMPVTDPQSILQHGANAEIVAIDEVQFFETGIRSICEQLALKGKRVIVAGLNMDSNGEPFGEMPGLLAVAEQITKLTAVCVICNEEATHTYRKADAGNRVMIGGSEFYEPRCRNCFNAGESLSKKNLT